MCIDSYKKGKTKNVYKWKCSCGGIIYEISTTQARCGKCNKIFQSFDLEANRVEKIKWTISY